MRPNQPIASFSLEDANEFENVTLAEDSNAKQQGLGGKLWTRFRAALTPARGQHAFQRLAEGEEGDGAGATQAFASSSLPPGAQRPPGRWCPEEGAGFMSRMLFNYVGGLVKMGYLKTLDQEDLWDVAQQDEALAVSDSFAWHLRSTVDELKSPQGVLWRAMWRAHGRTFVLSGLLKLFHDVVMFAGPLILEQLLKHVQAGGSPWVGLGLATALAAAAVLETLTVNWYFHMLYRISLHLKVGLVDTLFRKSLRISSAAKGEAGVGAIVNLQSNDAAKLWTLPQYMHIIWSGPFQILVVMGLLVRVIHFIPALAGLAVTLAFIPLTTWLGRRLSAVRKQLVKHTDARVKLCTEVITGIKAIKLYAWEGPYTQRIEALREEELRAIRRSSLLGTLNSLTFMSAPTLVSLAAFSAFALLGYPLTAAVAFPALSLFNLLRFPVAMFPQQIMNIINGKVALHRIQKFMEAEEMEQAPLLAPASPPAPAIDIRGCDFRWGSEEGEPLLRDISLSVGGGQLVIVVGSVGCGKSSLLAALLGEMRASKGSVHVRGNVALTQQDPWIQNASLQENILMGSALDPPRYHRVLQACALLPDLEMLPAGDQTEIGEKGVNLSGGQRHRVALARACYAPADVYLLDDPLSAVDAHVGRHLFDACICGELRDRTRVLVTHQLQYLPAADCVVVMREGRIAERGTFQELVARGVDFHQFAVEAEGEGEGAAEGETLGGGHVPSEGSFLLEADEVLGPGGPAADVAGAAAGSTVVGAPPSPAATAPAEVAVETEGEQGGCMEGSIPAVFGGRGEEGGVAQDGTADLCAAATTGVVTPPFVVDQRGAETPPSPFRGSPGGKGGSHMNGMNGITLKAGVNGQHGAKLPTAPTTRDLGAAARLTKKEERAVGRVDTAVYRTYFTAWGPLLLLPLGMLSIALVERGLLALQNWWLSVWSNATAASEASELARSVDGMAQSVDTAFYMGVYFGFGLTSLLLQGGRAVVLVLGTVNAARVLQANLLTKVIRLPQSFFDSQPTGRLLNRFTKDTEAVDTSIGSSVNSFLNCAVSVMWSMVVVVAVSPAIVAAIVPLALSYYWVQARYIRSSRELKRLDSLALSPIFGNFSETLQGLVTVRAFRQQSAFEQRNARLLDQSNRAWWPAQCVNRWLSVRLELLGISVVFGTAVFVAVITPRNAGLAGLALTSALNLTGLMNWMVRQTTELEVNMNSVERMIEYTTYESEAPAIVPERRPLPSWPSQGAIEVQQLVVRYRPDLDPVLKSLSFSVRGKEKVGIVGRTGCGKSTLMLALYRLVEPSGGRIIIDGVDTSSIGLYDLRSRLALVPQDPVVFSGTIRSNLDPFGDAKGDGAIWGALKQAGLMEAVKGMQGGLDAQVSEGGGNLSVGQRQLLCMARALLRAARVLILDEATSNVDTGTDALIQSTIATAFSECTVLTIAHRLHTIMDSDRILVLAEGAVQEFDPPATLLRRPGSAFRALVEETAKQRGQE